MLNVFGQLKITPKDVDLSRYFKELARVVKIGGRVVIGEYYSRAGDFDEYEYQELTTSDYQQFGFKKTVLQGKSFKDFLRQNTILTDLIEKLKPENPFFLVLTKEDS